MKTQSSLSLVLGLAVLVLGAARPARAQTARFAGSDYNAGLLGQTYTSGEFSYLRRADGPPRTLHRYTLVSTTLLPDLNHVDGAFRYSYTRGGSAGTMSHRHDVSASFTHFVAAGDMKPFIRGDLGWSWSRKGELRERSVLYVAGIGAELLLAPRFAVTPYVNYQGAPQLDERIWTFGTKLTGRFNREWSGTFDFGFEDTRNLNFAVAAQRRF